MADFPGCQRARWQVGPLKHYVITLGGAPPLILNNYCGWARLQITQLVCVGGGTLNIRRLVWVGALCLLRQPLFLYLVTQTTPIFLQTIQRSMGVVVNSSQYHSRRLYFPRKFPGTVLS